MEYYFISGCLGIIVWAIRLESKVHQNDIRQIDLKELIESKLSDVKSRLERIERLILNGSYH